MPGEVIDQANPPPLASLLPNAVDNLIVTLDYKNKLDPKEREALGQFRRAAAYLAASMIFLSDNVLVERDLKKEDIRPRLLGHWGTCPGIIAIYAHTNRLLRNHPDIRSIYVVGPGHGAPAILASLWLEGSLGRFFPEYQHTKSGLHRLVTGFSTPSGFPSHINAETPGCIHEGGELGYALSVAFGAIMDKPDLVITCIVGDGEAESGPTATAWHGYKYIDPAESGALIPVVHINGFKISERTIYGCMDDKELVCLFTGYGYQVRFVEDLENFDDDLAASFEWALTEIQKIQKAARSGKPITKPRWPVLLMRTPKGWGCPKKIEGEFIEGSFHSHQVPLPAAKTDDVQLLALQNWLRSYKPEELFDAEAGKPIQAILDTFPKEDNRKLGQVPESFTGNIKLDLPDWRTLAQKKEDGQKSCMKSVGALLKETIVRNPKSFRIFSPDELESNKLAAVFDVTGRNFQWDQYSRTKGGRIIEILSEHTCQGMMQGYTLTGRTALFPSYESFLGIIHTMMVQYSKFNKMGMETNWRTPISSINYLETSTWTRQEHNGFSHQNPSFIGAVLNLKPKFARVYLPADANCFLSTMHHCLKSKNYVNLMVGSKQETPVWLSPEEAESHCRAGSSVFKFASTDEGVDPDVVLVGIGCELMFEVISAAALLRKACPELRVRVVNVSDLMILGSGHPHSLTTEDFDSLFTKDRAIIFNYHGYTQELKGLLFGRPGLDRVTIEGYAEEGSTTTPFDMMLRNNVSRYDVAMHAVRGAGMVNRKIAPRQHELISNFKTRVTEIHNFIFKNGTDIEGTYDVPKFNGSEPMTKNSGGEATVALGYTN